MRWPGRQASGQRDEAHIIFDYSELTYVAEGVLADSIFSAATKLGNAFSGRLLKIV